jgi:hypothetical protein
MQIYVNNETGLLIYDNKKYSPCFAQINWYFDDSFKILTIDTENTIIPKTNFSDVTDQNNVAYASKAAFEAEILSFFKPSTSVSQTSDINSLISESYTLTGSFAKIGTAINTQNKSILSLYFDITFNNSTEIQLIAYKKLTETSNDKYPFVIETITETLVSQNKDVRQLENAQQFQVVDIQLNNSLFVEINIKAGTVGATAGTVNALKYLLS